MDCRACNRRVDGVGPAPVSYVVTISVRLVTNRCSVWNLACLETWEAQN